MVSQGRHTPRSEVTMKKVFLVLGFISFGAIACDCGPIADNFQDTIKKHSQTYGPLVVVSGKVLKHKNFKENYLGKFPVSMDFQVTAVHRGVLDSTVITVNGDDGMSCRRYINEFPEGTKWQLALIKEPQHARGYSLSSCGVYFRKLD